MYREVSEMKKLLALLLSALLAAALCLPGAAADGVGAVRTGQALSVDGRSVSCDVYNIGGSNYFKLRDVAALLTGTGSQFDVDYNADTRAITLTPGAAYTPDPATDLVIGEDRSASAKESTQAVRMGGGLVSGLSAYNIGDNNYFQLRQLGVMLGFGVDYDSATRTMLVTSSTPERPYAPQEINFAETVTFAQRQAVGGITADVLTVNVRNPRVHVRSCMVDDTVAARAPFADIVARAAGAVAVITGNFMDGTASGPLYPVGTVMCGGELRYIGGTFSALGITDRGEVRVGRPSIRVRMNPTDRQCIWYNAVGVNMPEAQQAEQLSVLYTPAYGASFGVSYAGCVTVVSGGKVTAYGAVGPGDRTAIPADGFVLLMSDTYMGYIPAGQYVAPAVGEGMELEYYLYRPDEEGFTLDGVTQIIGGGPRLVKDGAPCTELEPQFSDRTRFADSVSSSRTAVGVTAEGRLIFLSTAAATIPQLREAMLALGCEDAFNLDGGASTALWYGGAVYRAPSRDLATTVQIYVD